MPLTNNRLMNTVSHVGISSLSDDRISKINSLTSDKGDSILMYYSTVSSSIEFIHSISGIGSTNWSRQPVLVALNGFTSTRVILVIIKIESLFDVIKTDAPTLIQLLSIADQELFNLTVAPDLHSQQIHHLPFILLLQFLWKTASLCELKDRSPGSVFIAFSKCIDEFIEANEDDETLIKRLFSLSIFWLSLILTKSRN